MSLKINIITALVFSFVAITTQLSAQEIAFNYGFNDCTYESDGANFPGLTPLGPLTCVCGPGGQAIRMNGSGTGLTASPQATPIMEAEGFTLDFYFSADPLTGTVDQDIFSHINRCNTLDSLVSLKYVPSEGRVLFEIGSEVNNYSSVRAALNPNICWHRFTLVKFRLDYQVYLDNELIKTFKSKETVEFSKNAVLSFSNSSCQGNNLRSFNGKIDEITLYRRALTPKEIKDLYLFPDQIINNNTTIVKGETVQINTGFTCSNLPSWSPITGLDDATSFDPIASPEETTTYAYTINDAGCVSTDTLTIFVADPENIDCSKLLLPKAFTPNNDGLNDTYGISNPFIISGLEYFEVYNRSGAVIWQTTNALEKWDGNAFGSPSSGGMYLYKIRYRCRGEDYTDYDSFTMIR